MLFKVFEIIGSLGVFLFGMKVMSDGIQKSAGQKLQSVLNFMTQNRFIGVLTGLIITSIIQSSSATTVMVVSFVNAGLLTLTQSISVIMGANIGTTITTWIVSFFGFKFSLSQIAVPVVGIGLPFMFAKKKKHRDLGDFIIGFGILFIGLGLLKDSVPDISKYPEVLKTVCGFSQYGFVSYILFVLAGTILTMIIQSSSAMMTITVAMAYKGWLDFPSAAALCLGENIGTTITAYLASLGANVNARRAARAHTLFNVFGVLWMSFVFQQFTAFTLKLTPWQDVQANLPLSLALFHTLFNLTNTIVLIGFIPVFAKVVERLVKPQDRDKETGYKLRYLSVPLQDTPQVNIIEVKRETDSMAKLVSNMYESVTTTLTEQRLKDDEYYDGIRKIEILTDEMQEEITKYIMQCYQENLSEANTANLNLMSRIIHELESIADSAYNISKLNRKMLEKQIKLHPQAQSEMNDLIKLNRSFLGIIVSHVGTRIEKDDLEQSYSLEGLINDFRNKLFKEARVRMQNGSDVRSELLYLDIVKYLEHIGDNALNIVQALSQMMD